MKPSVAAAAIVIQLWLGVSAAAQTPAAGFASVAQPAVSATAAAQIPKAGIAVAGITVGGPAANDGDFYIYQLTPTGPTVVFHEANTAARIGGWLDGQNFVVVDAADAAGDIRVRVFRKGLLQKSHVVAAAAWPDQKKAGAREEPALLFAGKTILLQACMSNSALLTSNHKCLSYVTVQIRGNAVRGVATAPANAKPGRVGIKAPFMKPPKTPSVEIVPATSVPDPKRAAIGLPLLEVDQTACSADGTTVRWPAANEPFFMSLQATALTWQSARPPLYTVSAEVVRTLGRSGEETFTFEGCAAKPLHGFVLIRQGIWAKTARPQDPALATWQIFAGAEPIAVLRASDASFYPAPQ